MARGRHYAKLSLSNAARLSFSDLCILLFMFLSLCRLCVCVFLCSHWSLVDVPLIFFCPADHVPDWQPRVLLGMVEARSVNVKKTTTTTTTRCQHTISSKWHAHVCCFRIVFFYFVTTGWIFFTSACARFQSKSIKINQNRSIMDSDHRDHDHTSIIGIHYDGAFRS